MVDDARRERAALLFYDGKLDEAFAMIDGALDKRAARLTTTAQRGPRPADPKRAALDDAANIVRWADRLTPEWVRAIGGLAEVTNSASVKARFEKALREMVAESRAPVSDLEVVIRQAQERNLESTALAATELLCARHPSDLAAARIAGGYFLRHGAFERAWPIFARAAEANPDDASVGLAWLSAAELALRAGDTTSAHDLLGRARAAIETSDPALSLRIELASIELERAAAERKHAESLWTLFERTRADTRLLAETNEGRDLADVTIQALLRTRDRRALAVATAMHRAKVELWGERPTTWLEQHNVGVVLSELGETAQARELVTATLERLRTALGEEHAHVKTVERTLAKLARA